MPAGERNVKVVSAPLSAKQSVLAVKLTNGHFRDVVQVERNHDCW